MSNPDGATEAIREPDLSDSGRGLLLQAENPATMPACVVPVGPLLGSDVWQCILVSPGLTFRQSF